MITKIKSINALEGALYKVAGEDGELIVYDLLIEAILPNGDVYYHNHVFKGHVQDQEGFEHPNYNAKDDAHKLVKKILLNGNINTKFWYKAGNITDRECEVDDGSICYENENAGV